MPTSSSTLDDNVGDEACTTCKYKVHVLYAVQAHVYVLLHAFLWWIELLHVGKHNYIINDNKNDRNVLNHNNTMTLTYL